MPVSFTFADRRAETHAGAGSGRLLPDFVTVTGSKILNSALAFAFAVIAARVLGPVEYAFLTLSFAVTAIAAELTGYGIETAFVRLTVRAPVGAAHRQEPPFGSALGLKLAGTALVMAVGWTTADAWAGMLGNAGYALAIRMGLVGALGSSLWRLTLVSCQSAQAFGAYAIVQSVSGVVKVAGLLVLLLAAELRLFDVLVVHVASFFVGFVVGLWLLPAWSRRVASIGDAVAWKALLDYGKWIVAGSMMSTVNLWLGVVMVGYFLSPRLVGEYAAAHALMGVFDVILVSLNTVFLPMACRIRGGADARAYLKTTLRVSSGLALLILPTYFLAGPLIGLIYSDAFAGSTAAYRILFWGLLISMYVQPALLIVHSQNRPQVITKLEALKLGISAVAYLVLVPRFAVVGAALAAALTRIAGGIVGSAIVYGAVKTQPQSA